MLFPRPTQWATLVQRHNRFVGEIRLPDGEILPAHIPNTGPLKTILHMPQQSLVMQSAGKLPYQLQAVELPSNNTIVGIYSSLANTIAKEWLQDTLPDITFKKEVTYGSSRFDFGWIDTSGTHILEVKSVSLVDGHVAQFPDTPSLRAHKHLSHLYELQKQGFICHILFVVQRSDADSFTPAQDIDPIFSGLLRDAHTMGIEIRAITCDISVTGIQYSREIPVLFP